MKKIILVACLIATVVFVNAQTSNEITGVWSSGNKKMKVEIFEKENKFFGKIVWLAEDVKRDVRVGDIVIEEMEYNAKDNLYKKGKFIYGQNKLDCEITKESEEHIEIKLKRYMLTRKITWTKTTL